MAQTFSMYRRSSFTSELFSMATDLQNCLNKTGENVSILEPHHITDIIFGILIIILGIPGNILIIWVYSAKKLRGSASTFIIALAVSDLIVCIIHPLIIFRNMPLGDEVADKNEFLCRFPPTLTFFLGLTSTFITSAIAIDRYFAVCKPLKRIMTSKRVVVLCWLLPVPIALPRAFVVRRLVKTAEALTKCVSDDQKDFITKIPIYVALFSSLTL